MRIIIIVTNNNLVPKTLCLSDKNIGLFQNCWSDLYLLLQFNDEHIQFCSEIAVIALKKDRFQLDAAKIKGDESQCTSAFAGLVENCRILTMLYESHDQMCLVSPILSQIERANSTSMKILVNYLHCNSILRLVYGRLHVIATLVHLLGS